MSTFTDNSTVVYTGKEVQQLILQTFFESTTFETSKKMPKVKTVGKIWGLSASDVLGPAGCDFVEHGELAYEDKEIRTYMVGVSQQICEDELEGMELETLLKDGSGNVEFMEQTLIDVMNESLIGKGGEEIEIALWQGVRTGSPTNLLNTINGFDHWLAASTAVIKFAAPAATLDASNIVGELEKFVATFPKRLIGKKSRKGVAILMSPATYQAYIDARAASPGNPTLFLGPEATANGMVFYNGYQIEMRMGMADNTMVFCEYGKNLVVGTEIENEKNELRYVWMADKTADYKVRIRSRFPLGTQIGRDEDIVVYGTQY